ncbi:Alpha/Beta hydrolase protein [Aspergillus unguis]
MHSHLAFALTLGVFASVSASPAPSSPASSDLRVLTSSGLVQGIYNDTSESVRAFLGIPYAEPPTGEARWLPPRPKSASSASEPLDASSFGAPCPQVYSFDNESIWSILPYRIWNAPDMSEDCLFVNVWAPSAKTFSKEDKKAVLLFIHGGGFTEGAGSIGFYDGSNLVRDQGDVLVVTFNYRLNVFGYPNAPGLERSEQNVGLLDQRLAVEWVHANIANFGGDPDRILLFGQSAGAASVDGYAYAYPDDPFVSGFVMESGTVSLFDNTDTAHSNWNALARSLDCGSGPDSLDCMRSLPFDKIIQGMNNGSYTFTPVVDNRTVFADYPARAEEGNLSKLPTLAGINAREFSAGFPLSQTSINETAVFDYLYTSFACPAQEAVRTRLDQNIPTWRYIYHGNFTNLSPRPWLGAYHSSEIPILFGTYNQTYLPPRPGRDEIETSRYIQDAWVSFAKDPEAGLSEYGWPEFSFDDDTLVNLAVHNKPGMVLGSSASWDKHCDGAELVS